MNEEAMIYWFKHYSGKSIKNAEVEDIYQAFKARLKSEATLNLWPEEHPLPIPERKICPHCKIEL